MCLCPLDGTSIPAACDSLKRIEDGLVRCIGAIYLISPASVKRNWINFELGAVWVRNVMNLQRRYARDSDASRLSLRTSSGVVASAPKQPQWRYCQSSMQLEFAFRSLQTAVGGKGDLKSNFDALASQVISLEKEYTLGANIVKLFSLLGGDKRLLVQHCEQHPPGTTTTVDCGFVETSKVQEIKALEANELKDHIHVAVDSPGTSFGALGAVNGAQFRLEFHSASPTVQSIATCVVEFEIKGYECL